MKHFLLSMLLVSFAGLRANAQVTSFPWTQDFSTLEAFETFTVIDANEDGKTWTYDDYAMGATCDRDDEANDWLVSEAFTLEAGRTYVLSFDAAGYSADVPETFTVYLGTSPASFTQQIYDGQAGSDRPQTHSARFQVDATGNYYFAIMYNTSSVGFSGSLTISKMKLDYGQSLRAPQPVSDLNVVPGDRGALSATISFRTPTTDVSGTELSGKLTSVRILRDGTPVKTFEQPATGEALSYEDNTVPSGIHTYSVIAVNEEGESEVVETTIFVGIDQPAPPQNVHASYKDGKVTVTWDAPAVGVNGGYIDVDRLSYVVKNNKKKILANQLQATMFEETISIGEEYYILFYDIQAVTTSGTSDVARSNRLVFGPPEELPYYESFPKGKATHYWAIDYDHLSRWWPMDASDVYTQDADKGFLGFTPMEKNEWSRYLSGPISLKGAENPVLTFYYRYEYAGYDPFKFEIARNGGELEVVRDFDLTGTDNTGRWQKVTINLREYCDADYIQIAFSNRSTSTTSLTYIDNISIIDQREHDLIVHLAEVPRDLKVGEARTFSAVVTNIGTEAVAAGDYTVELYAAGEKLASSRGRELASEAKRTYILTASASIQMEDSVDCYAVISYEADQYLPNNTSGSVRLGVKPNYYPIPTELSVTEEGLLTWNVPESPRAEDGFVTEGFEDAPTWTITNFDDWTLIDGDQSPTYSVAVGGAQVVFPNTGKPLAWIIVNATSVGLPETWNAYAGLQAAVSMSSASVNDNWLISPELSGHEQTISFYTKGLRSSDKETYQLLYSTTDVATTSFRLLSDAAVVVTSDWQKAEYDLPEGARYFAIRSIRDNGFALFVDDVTFCPDSLAALDLMLLGYNLYRDGQKLNSAPLTDTTYMDASAPTDAVYRVTAVYAEGESGYSEVAIKGYVGINSATVTVQGNGRIYDLQGRLVDQLSRGVHIVGGKKVIR